MLSQSYSRRVVNPTVHLMNDDVNKNFDEMYVFLSRTRMFDGL